MFIGGRGFLEQTWTFAPNESTATVLGLEVDEEATEKVKDKDLHHGG